MRFSHSIVTLTIAAAFLVACGNSLKVDRLAEGRNLVDEARQVLKAYDDAIRMGQAESAQKHKVYARTLLDDAIQHYDDLNIRKSRDAELLVECAEVFLMAGYYDWAGQSFERAAILSEIDPGYWLVTAEAYSFSGISYRQKAVDAVHQCLAQVGEDADQLSMANAILGRIFWDSEQYLLAESHFDVAVEANPRNDWALMGQSLTKIRNGDLVAGNTNLSTLTSLNTRQQQWLFKQWEVVTTPLEKMLSTFDDTAANHFIMAQLFLRANRTPDAILALKYSLSLDGSNYQAWNMLGGLSLQTGKVPDAKEAYNKSLGLNSNQPRTREILNSL